MARFLSFVPAPWITKTLVDDIVLRADVSVLPVLVVLMMALACVYSVSSTASKYLFALLVEHSTNTIRYDLLHEAMFFESDMESHHGSGHIISRLTSDALVVGTATRTVLALIIHPVVEMATILAILFTIDWQIGLLAAGAMPGYMIIPILLRKRVELAHLKAQQANVGATDMVLQVLRAVPVIRAMNLDDWILHRLRSAFATLRRQKVRGAAYMGTQYTSTMIYWIMYATVFLLLAPQAMDGEVGVGVVFALAMYVGWLNQPVQMTVSGFYAWQSAVGTADHLGDILIGRSRTPRCQRPKKPTFSPPHLRLSDISTTSGEGAHALRGISLDIHPGTFTALVGNSGGGKSTLLDVIIGRRNMTSGTVLVDGSPVVGSAWSEWRARAGIMFQDNHLFIGTVEENIIVGRSSISTGDVERAVRIADAAETFAGLPNGLHTLLGPEDHQLSTGEVQRLALARAIAGWPELLLLDEPTSALDAASEERILQSLISEYPGTLIMVSHRPAPVRHADLIVFLERGEVIAYGTHTHLLHTCPTYTQNFQSRATGDGKKDKDIHVTSQPMTERTGERKGVCI